MLEAKMDIATFSLIVSFVSLYVAIRVAWETIFAPPKLVTILSQIVLFSKFGDDECSVVMRAMIPSLTIRNIGAKVAIIENVRLVFHVTKEDSNKIYTYPESIVDIDKILNDQNKYMDTGHLGFPININEMFSGFSLTSGETWSKSYSYTLPKEELQKVSDKAKVSIEIKTNKGGWRSIHSSIIDFNDSFNTLPEDEGFSVSICRPENHAD